VKRAIVTILFVVLLLTIVSLVIVSFHQKEWYAFGRLMIKPDPNDSYNPYFFQTQFQTISNVLCSSEFSDELAGTSQVKRGSFSLVQVGPIRSTYMVYVRYVGFESNSVERVASNACVIIQRFYSTNQPSLQVSYVGTFPNPPEPWWQRIINKLPYALRR
jgi:hypothetical protein